MPQPATVNETFLTSGEAARLAGVAVETIRFWERTGKLQAAQVLGSGVRLYRRDDVLTTMARRAADHDAQLEQRCRRG